MFLITLLRFYPGIGRFFFLAPFALMLLLGSRLMRRFLSQPGRTAGDGAIPIVIVSALLILLIGCVKGWFTQPGWVENLLISSGRSYPLGVLLEGLFVGLLLPVVKPAASWMRDRFRKQRGQ